MQKEKEKMKSKKATNSKNGIWIIIAVLALVLIGALVQKNYGFPFSIYNIGGYSANPECTFITNIDSLEARYSTFDNTGAWISIDVNSDGVLDKFGKSGSGEGYGARAVGCGRTGSSAVLLIDNYNSAGDDIYYYNSKIYVCQESGYHFVTFAQNHGASNIAINTCDVPSQEFQCTAPGQSVCHDLEHHQTCNSNLQLSGLLPCAYGCDVLTGNCKSSGEPTCTEHWTCGSWTTCNNQQQSRTCYDSNNCGTTNDEPITTQYCQGPIPACTESDWDFSDGVCQSTSKKVRSWELIGYCTGGVNHPSQQLLDCIYNAPACTYTYSGWSACTPSGTQSRTVISQTPSGCEGTPSLVQGCTYDPGTRACADNDFTSSLSPTICPSTGTQTKTYTKVATCVGTKSVETVSCNPGDSGPDVDTFNFQEILTKYWWAFAIAIGLIVFSMVKK